MKLSDYVNGLTEDTTPEAADLLMTYDNSAAGLKKTTVGNLLATVGAGIGLDGWTVADAMTYAGADAPTFTLTITGDQTAKYSPGMRVKLTQTTVKYFIITAVAYGAPNTTLTLYGGTDYTLVNAAITSPYYSVVKAPAHFPLDPAKWSVIVSNTGQNSQASPTQNTWYNLGTVNISIPIGCWRVMYEVISQVSRGTGNAGSHTTLSTGNNSETDTGFSTYAVAANVDAFATLRTRNKFLTLAAKTTYYLNTKTDVTGVTTLYNRGDSAPIIIRAECAYL